MMACKCNEIAANCGKLRLLVAVGRDRKLVYEVPPFWRTVKRNIEETSENVFTIGPKKVFLNSNASKMKNKPGLTGRQALLALSCERANQKPRTENVLTRLATGSRKSHSKNTLRAKDVS